MMKEKHIQSIVCSTKFTNTCWLWIRSIENGYARIGSIRVHILMYENLIAPVPKDLVLDHLCRVRNCINPYHLEPVTRGENVRRGEAGKYQTLRTHCPKNHEYTPENTRRYAGKRFCKQCSRERKHK